MQTDFCLSGKMSLSKITLNSPDGTETTFEDSYDAISSSKNFRTATVGDGSWIIQNTESSDFPYKLMLTSDTMFATLSKPITAVKLIEILAFVYSQGNTIVDITR